MTCPNLLRLLLLLTLSLAAPQASAQVFRCEDSSGKVTYSDTRCTQSQSTQEIIAPLSDEDKAQTQAQYQQALERKRQEQALLAEREAARQKARAATAAAENAKRPNVVAPALPAAEPPAQPIYVPVPYPMHRPRMHRPLPPPPQPNSQAPGYNCNVFRCYDGKGNTWQRP